MLNLYHDFFFPNTHVISSYFPIMFFDTKQ